MPIIVDPDAVNPPLPEEMTSPDGILNARIDNDHAGVRLHADFSRHNELWDPYLTDPVTNLYRKFGSWDIVQGKLSHPDPSGKSYWLMKLVGGDAATPPSPPAGKTWADTAIAAVPGESFKAEYMINPAVTRNVRAVAQFRTSAGALLVTSYSEVISAPAGIPSRIEGAFRAPAVPAPDTDYVQYAMIGALDADVTTGNSGFSLVNRDGGVIKYLASKGIRFTSDADGSYCIVRGLSSAANNVQSVRMRFKVPTAPAAELAIGYIRNNVNDTPVVRIVVNSAGQLFLRDAVNANLGGGPIATIAFGTVYDLTMLLTVATTTTGQITAKLYDGVTQVGSTITSTTANLGTLTINGFELGITSSNAATTVHWFDVKMKAARTTEIASDILQSPAAYVVFGLYSEVGGSGAVTFWNPKVHRLPAASFDDASNLINEWSGYGTVTLNTASQALAIAWTVAQESAGAKWTLPQALPGGRMYRVRFEASVTAGLLANRMRVAFAPTIGSTWKFVDLPNPVGSTRYWQAEAYCPPGTDLKNIYIYVNGSVNANKTLTLDQVFVEPVHPVEVRIERGGEPILSGHNAVAANGEAIAYDHYAPLDVPVTYRAFPIYWDGTEGVQSEGVTIVLDGLLPPDRANIWVKSLVDPNLSMPLLALTPLPTFVRRSRQQLSDIVNSPYPAGSYDQWMAETTELAWLSESAADRDRFEALFTSGPLLLQYRTDFGLRDMWVLAGDLTMAPHAYMELQVYKWSTPLTVIDEPSTIDSQLFLPGHSYNDIAALGTYLQAYAALPTYHDWAGR